MFERLKSIYRWLENLWNLKLIFDKYLPMIRELHAEIEQLRKQLEAKNTNG